jgi:hypothetical protein
MKIMNRKFYIISALGLFGVGFFYAKEIFADTSSAELTTYLSLPTDVKVLPPHSVTTQPHLSLDYSKATTFATVENLVTDKKVRLLFLPKGQEILTQKVEISSLSTSAVNEVLRASEINPLSDEQKDSFLVIEDFAKDEKGKTWVRGVFQNGETSGWVLSEELPVYPLAETIQKNTRKKDVNYLTIEEKDVASFNAPVNSPDYSSSADSVLKKGEKFEVIDFITVEQKQVPNEYLAVSDVESSKKGGYLSSKEVKLQGETSILANKLGHLQAYQLSAREAKKKFSLYEEPELEVKSTTISRLTDYHYTNSVINSEHEETTNYFVVQAGSGVRYIKANKKVAEHHYTEITENKPMDAVLQLSNDSATISNPQGMKQATKEVARFGKDRYLHIDAQVVVNTQENTEEQFYKVSDHGKSVGYVPISSGSIVDFSAINYHAVAEDSLDKIAQKYQLDVNKLREYNPEIFLENLLGTELTEVTDFRKDASDKLTEGDRIYLVGRENLPEIETAARELAPVLPKLDVPNEPRARKMVRELILAKMDTTPRVSAVVRKLGYLIPYIQYREFLPSVAFGQAVIESADGSSGLTVKDNNLFGYKGSYKGQSGTYKTSEHDGTSYYTTDANFRKYDTQEESLKDYLDLLEKAYNVKGITDREAYVTAVKAGGYATSPTYISTILSAIDNYDLAGLDTLDYSGNGD